MFELLGAAFNFLGESLQHSLSGIIANVVSKPILYKLNAMGAFNFDAADIVDQYTKNLCDEQYEDSTYTEIRKEVLDDVVCMLMNYENPCVVGEAGVGKTTLIELLAQKIKKGEVPDQLKNVKILKVDFVALITGRSYMQESSGIMRLKILFEYAEKHPDVILYIDEVHQFANGFADLCKTHLDRKTMRLIGTTTPAEFTNSVASDEAVLRRFSSLILDAPTHRETLMILSELRDSLEKKYDIKIPDKTLYATIELTDKYMKEISFPAKATKTLENAVKDVLTQSVINSKGENEGNVIITDEDIRTAVARRTNIPINTLSPRQMAELATIDDRLKEFIIGQDQAVNAVCRAVRKGMAGLNDVNHPRASFLFTGTPGVGKTALATLLGEHVGNTIHIDMAQFSNASTKENLIGNTYKGYKGGELTERIARNPYSVIIFDGIEKADKSILDLILGMLDTGYMTDCRGKKVYFNSSIVIMTTNVGGTVEEDNVDKATEVLTEKFGAGVVNRVDDVLLFKKFNDDSLKKITTLLLDQTNIVLSSANISLDFGNDVIEHFAKFGNDANLGIRGICKQVKVITDKVSDLYVRGSIKQGQSVLCSVGENGVDIKVQ